MNCAPNVALTLEDTTADFAAHCLLMSEGSFSCIAAQFSFLYFISNPLVFSLCCFVIDLSF